MLRNASSPSIDLWNSAQDPSWITPADTGTPAAPAQRAEAIEVHFVLLSLKTLLQPNSVLIKELRQ